MSTLEKVRALITELSPTEKAQALLWLRRDLNDEFPGIEQTPGVSGGEPCLVRTRIPVWVVVQARKLGSSDAEILQAYPSLRAEDLSNAWTYYEARQAEIEQQIAAHEVMGNDTLGNFQQGWKEAMTGQGSPVSSLWDDIDAE